MLKYKDISKMDKKAREEKLKELKVELIKKATPSNKSSKIKNKEIKKAIARILTANNAHK